MQNIKNSLLLLIISFTTSCGERVVDKLRPETIQFLTNQEQARCACLDMYGADFIKKVSAATTYINGLPQKYNLDSLTQAQFYQINLDLVSAMSIVKTVSTCIGERTPQIDQFTGMLMQEDLRVVLKLDSSMTEQQRLELINVPSIELLEEFCPKHKEAVLKLQEMIKAAQVLPPGLQ